MSISIVMHSLQGSLLVGLLVISGSPLVANATTLPGSSGASASPRLPFAFVENRGQADPRVRYTGTGPDFKAWFEDRGMILQQGQTAVRIDFAGAASSPRIEASDPMNASANYLRGNDPRRWRTALPLYASLTYEDLWRGIDLTYKAVESRVKSEYIVAPGAAVDEIVLRFDAETQIEPDGMLRVHGNLGDFLEDKPIIFQSIHGEKKLVAGEFRKLADGSIGFSTADYDHTEPLVIDPSILVSGYFGGSSQEGITALAVDIYNNIVVAGWTSSTDLPASGGVKTTNSGGVDAFVASFIPNGGGLSWCTYLGGSGDDRAFAVAIDGSRNIYLTGWTSSTNFPLVGAFQTRLGGTRDAFVAKLNPTGNSLIYSTYLGGSGVDVGYAITLDVWNSALIAGDSTSTNLPVTLNCFQPKNAGGQDAFVARIAPAGNSLTFLTYLGGSGTDHASSLKFDGSGNMWVGGSTFSTNFPTAAPYQTRSGGGQDGFVSKLSPNGFVLFFSTYLGGSGGSVGAPEEVNALSVDLLGNVVVAGTTSSANFPVTAGAFQVTFGGETDGFISRFSNAGMLLDSTYLGGALTDGINAMALDFHGYPCVTGYAVSQDFPTLRASQAVNNGSQNAFVVKLNATLSSEIFSTYLGGLGSDSGNAIAADFQTSMIVAGQTNSPNFPAAANLQSSLPSALSSFVSKFQPNFTLGVDSQSVIVTDPWHVSWDTVATVFGVSTDLPIVGDWDGTGKKRIGVFRNGTWYLDINGDGYFDAGDKTVMWGQAGDVPVVGDWTGVGHIALGLYRQGTFILDLSGHLTGVPTGQNDATYSSFGLSADIPVAADWNGSGTTKVGVFRNGSWLVDYNGDGVFNGSDRTYTYGQTGDLPVLGDWDSSGKPSKIGVYRSGLWILDYDGDNAWTIPGVNELVIGFGTTNFLPLVF